jgi:hypothetical protein
MVDVELQKRNLKKLLLSKDYLKVSYPLMIKLGCDAAAFISLLVKQESYNEENGKLDADGFFLFQRDYVQKKIGLTPKVQHTG